MKRFYKFLMPVVMIMAMAWPLSVKAQCDPGVTSCSVTIQLIDGYGDGWFDEDDNPCSINVYQGTTLRGTATLSSGYSGTATIAVCADDSVRFVWVGYDSYEECSFTILDGGGGTIIANAEGFNYTNNQTIIAVETPCPSCFAPSAFALAFSGDNANFTWTDTIGSAWEINYDVAGFNPDSVTTNLTPVTSTSYTIDTTTLTMGMYDVYVRTDCGSGDYSAWAGPISFGVGFFNYNMATSGHDTLRTCNANIYDNGGPDGGYASSVTSYLNLYPADANHIVKIWGVSQTESSWDYLRITDLGTNQIVFQDNTSGVYSATIDTLVSLVGFEIYFYSDGSVTYPGFEIHVACEDAPDCMPVQDLAVTYVAADSIELTWYDPAQVGSYLVEYRADGSTIWEEDIATDTTYVLDNIPSNTIYYFRVSVLCTNGDTSMTVGPVMGRTLAGAPINEFPFVCTFEDTTVNTHWVIENSDNGWFIGAATNNGGDNAMYISNDNGTSNSYSGSACVSYAYATFQLEAGEYAYSFDWKCQGESTYDYLRVAYAPYGTELPADYSSWGTGASAPTGFTSLDGGKLNLASTWQTKTGTFTVPAGVYNIYFVWRNDGSVYYSPAAAIDNFQLVRNTCPQPQNLRATYIGTDTIIVAWNAGGSEEEWEISLNGATPTSLTDSTYIFDNLYSNTPYTISVRGICGNDDTSMYSTLNVRTACGDMALPFHEDFESYTSSSTSATGITPACWDYVMTNSSYASSSYVPQVYYSTTSYYHHSGNYSLRLYGVSYTTLPPIADDVNLNQLSMGFWAMSTSTSYNVMVGVMSHPDSLNSFDTIQMINFPGTSAQYYFEIDFSNYTGTGRYIAFRNYYSSYGYSYIYLDDIDVWRNSTCATPVYVNASNISNDVATITWGVQDTANYNDVVVFWSTLNNLEAADSVVITDGSTSFELTNLTGSTTYYVWLKGNCADEPSRTITTSFTTTPDCVPVENLTVAGVDYHAFGINWDAPTTGFPATQYVVSWKHNSATAWTSDTTINTYYYIDGLGMDSLYQYRVTTLCDTLASTLTSGSARTLGCGEQIGAGGTTTSYLPTYPTYNYSYTQQIYLASELSNVDTISSISFYNSGNVQNRAVALYLANTDQASFSSTSNYIPADSLTLVSTGTLNGTGWLTLTLPTPFIRDMNRNLVVVMRDTTGSWVSAGSWTATSTSATRSIYFYQDSDPISMAAPSASYSSSLSVVDQILIQGPTCVVPDCGRPIVFIANAGSNQIDVAWNAENGLSYEVAYQINGDTIWNVVDAANTTGTANITGLTPGLDLTIRVSTNCNGISLTGTRNVSTACGPVALPYTENFELSPYGVFNRSCWVNGSTHLGTNYPNPYVISLTGDPNKLCLIYQGGYLIMPEMDAPLNELQIRFKFVQGGDQVRFLLGLLDTPETPITGIHVLDTLIRSNIDTTTSTVNITYSFANIDTTYNHARITFWDAFADNYSFIDDLVVEYIPQCSPVSGLNATTTTTTATIGWTTGGDNATNYIVEYGLHDFQPGTGTMVPTSTSSVTINGLAHSTTYDAYVYTICSALQDTSIASQVVTFTTECDVITTLPYSTTFEHILPPGSGSSVVMVPNCWATEAITTGYAPRVYYTTNLEQAPSQSYSLYFSNIGVAALPQMSMPLDSLMVSFHLYNASPNGYGLIVGAVDSITPGFAASFTPIDTILFQSGVNSYEMSSYLTDYNGTANRIALRNYNADTSSSYADIYLDNLSIDYVPSCIAPQRVRTTMLSNVAADLEWRISNAPNYSIEYGPHGFTAGTGTTLTSTTRSISLTGLTPYTEYDVRLVSLCSATETSDTTVFTFTTLRAAPVTNYPYFCDFTDSAMAAAWEPVNNATNGWYVGNAAHQGSATTDQSLYVSSDQGVTNNYNTSTITHIYAYRTFTLQPGSYSISFDWQAYGEGNYDYLRAYLVPAGMPIVSGTAPDGGTSSYSNATAAPQAGWIAIGSKLNQQGSWQSFAQDDLTITNAGNYNLVFYWGNDGSLGTQPPAAVDNISVARNVCPIADLQATNVTGSAATITWTGNSDEYQVEYGLSGAQGTLATTTSTSYSLTGLTSLTPYQFKVRGICNGGADTSRWYSLTFATEMCDNPTIAQNFDTASTGTSSYSPLGTSFYNYGYVQTLIDSADMATIGGDITAMAFYPASTSQGDYYSNMDIYLANVPENSLASSFIQPDSTTHVFVQVLTAGNLNYTTTDEQLVSFDAPFTWDGHSNVLVVVNRKHGSYSSGASFSAHTATVAKTRYAYQDGSAYNPYNITVSGTSSTTVGNLKLISCGGGCYAPSALHTTNVTYNSVSVAWSGTDSAEVGITQGLWDETSATLVTVTNGTYTFTGLTPNTPYTIAARTLCEENMTSAWVYLPVTTEDLPCFAPTDVTVSNETTSGAKVTWTRGGNETEWIVNVFRGTVESYDYSVINTPMCNVSGLYSNTEYSVKVGSVCGGIDTVWSEPATFHTLACLPPDTVNAVVNGSNATVTWNSTSASEYHVLWFTAGFTTDGDSAVVTGGTTYYTITGLEGGEDYDIYVYAYCDGMRSTGAGQTTISVNGIDDVNGSLVNLYPNPANTTVTVDGIKGEALVTIVDMNGRTVFSEKTVSSITIDLNGMAKGAYFVRITGENTSAIRKLIVK